MNSIIIRIKSENEIPINDIVSYIDIKLNKKIPLFKRFKHKFKITSWEVKDFGNKLKLALLKNYLAIKDISVAERKEIEKEMLIDEIIKELDNMQNDC